MFSKQLAICSLSGVLFTIAAVHSTAIAQAPTVFTRAATILSTKQRNADPILGNWQIAEAHLPSGLPYTGTVKIESSQQLYRLHWETLTGTYVGLAFLKQDHLLATFGPLTEIYGVAIYQIGADGTLNGQWTTSSQQNGNLGTEIATNSSPGQLAGNYRISGTAPGDRNSYRGALSIRSRGDTYLLNWTVGDESRSGIGLQSGEWLIVGWGEPGGFGVMDYSIDPTGLKGRWAVMGQSFLGTENLVRR